MRSLSLLSALLVTLPCVGQSVQVSLSALTPLTATITNGTSGANSSYAAGPLPAYGGHAASIPTGNAGVSWNVFTTPGGSAVQLTHGIANPTLSPILTGRVGPHEFLLSFTAPTVTPVRLEATRTLDLGTGAPAPLVQLDIDNDGFVDVPDLSTTTGATYPAIVGPQPFVVRVVVDASLTGASHSSQFLALVLTPDNGIDLQVPVTGCAPMAPPPPPFLQPSFTDLGVDLLMADATTAPSVAVLSFGVQPVLLAMNGILPCVLLPSPDVLLFLPTGEYHLPLPVAVRPVTFYAQGVSLTAAGLRTTDGYAVTAN